MTNGRDTAERHGPCSSTDTRKSSGKWETGRERSPMRDIRQLGMDTTIYKHNQYIVAINPSFLLFGNPETARSNIHIWEYLG
jgi:hypothetical protein